MRGKFASFGKTDEFGQSARETVFPGESADAEILEG